MTTGSVTCATCRFWNPPSPRYTTPAECRRYPPTAMVGATAWPRTAPDASCGEHSSGSDVIFTGGSEPIVSLEYLAPVAPDPVKPPRKKR